MRFFKFRGGVHPDAHKLATAIRPIERLPLPEVLYIPLQQHIGAPAEPEVCVGQEVLKGQLLAHSQGMISAPVHAPTSGRIVEIGEYPAPHPSGLPVRTIVLRADGEDKWLPGGAPADPFELAAEEIAARVGAAGIVGMGGATFPAAVKLSSSGQQKIHTLIINGGECEPYLTCDDRLMREQPEEIIDGVRIMLHTLGAERALIAIEDNKPAAATAMARACAACGDAVEVIQVPSRYPMGSEKQMIKALTGKEVPAGRRTADIGIVVHNVATAHAVHTALRAGHPLVSRVVTVSGGAIAEPKNVIVPIGTLVKDLVAFCGGYSEAPARLLVGGPMMGQMLPHDQVPVVKGTSGIIALTAAEIRTDKEMPCIRCGACVQACPCGLMPLEMVARSRRGDADGAVDYGLSDCIACGCCAYVCPSNIPMVQYFNYAKGLLADKREAQVKADRTRRLAEERASRLEREQQAKAEAARKRAAAAAARRNEKTEPAEAPQ
jgi:electron transport complex protein RnfC